MKVIRLGRIEGKWTRKVWLGEDRRVENNWENRERRLAGTRPPPPAPTREPAGTNARCV